MSQCYDARRCLARRGGTVGVNHTMVSSLALVFEVVAVAIRAYALTNFLLQMVLGAKEM